MDHAHLYTVVLDPGSAPRELDVSDLGDSRVLAPHHLLVVSPLTQSELYHDVKHRLPTGAALFVARLDTTPKMKGQPPGSVAWTREVAALHDPYGEP